MLFKEGEFGPRVRQDVPRFTAHEVCHHWLGNLVTLEWWGWLWLSEMYAMYYEYYLPSQVRKHRPAVLLITILGFTESSMFITKHIVAVETFYFYQMNSGRRVLQKTHI